MYKVIRCGQKVEKSAFITRRWTEAEILRAAWELDDQLGIRVNPMKGGPELRIAPLVPMVKKNKQDNGDCDEG